MNLSGRPGLTLPGGAGSPQENIVALDDHGGGRQTPGEVFQGLRPGEKPQTPSPQGPGQRELPGIGEPIYPCGATDEMVGQGRRRLVRPGGQIVGHRHKVVSLVVQSQGHILEMLRR